MAVPALETLARISAPVLSVYLNINPALERNQSHPPGYLAWLRDEARRLEATLASPDRRLFREQLQRLEESLLRDAPEGRGLVAFAGPATWQRMVLQVEVPDTLSWGPPELAPLIRLLEEQRSCGLVLVDRSGARFFRYSLGELIEDHDEAIAFDTTQWRRKDLMPPSQPGIEQVRGSQRDAFERRIEAQYIRFLAQEAGHLSQWAERYRLPVIFVAGAADLAELLLEEASGTLRDRLVHIDKDVVHRTPAELREIVAQELRRWEEHYETRLVERLLDESNGTRAVVGLAPTLEKLQQGLAWQLVLARSWNPQVRYCPHCQWLEPDGSGTCAICGGPQQAVNLRTVLPALAARYKAALEIVDGEAAKKLLPAGGIGARLR